MRGIAILFTLVFSVRAYSGLWEVLSSGAYYLGDTCQQTDITAANRALDAQANDQCSTKASSPSHARSIRDHILGTSENELEDRFFVLLAKEKKQEMHCAEVTTKRIASGEGDEFQDVLSKLPALKALRKKMKEQSELLSRSLVGSKVCPSSLEELHTNFKTDPAFETCDQFIRARSGYEATLASIPANGVSELRRMLELEALNDDMSGSSARMKTAFSMASSSIAKSAAALEDFASGKQPLDRNLRISLFEDSKIVQKVINDARPNHEAITAVACRADSRYGKGADRLSLGLTIGSLAVTGGAMATSRAVAARVWAGANSARASGLLSLRTSRVLMASALGFDTLNTMHEIDKSCPAPNRPELLASGGTCANDIEELSHTNCVLAKSLAALQFGGLFVVGLKMPRVAMETPEGVSATGYQPIKRKAKIQLERLIRLEKRALNEIKAMGVGVEASDQETSVSLMVKYGSTKIISNGEVTQEVPGSLLKITDLPVAHTRGGPKSAALLHPKMRDYKTRLEAMGFDLTIDTTLGSNGMGAYFRRPLGRGYIAIRPQSTWQTFLHEFQHAEFNLTVENLVAKPGRAQFQKIQFRSIDDLPSNVRQTYNLKEQELIKKFINGQLPPSALNEELSVGREMEALGWRRYLPSTGDQRNYATKYSISLLQDRGDLTDVQRRHLIQSRALHALRTSYWLGSYASLLGGTHLGFDALIRGKDSHAGRFAYQVGLIAPEPHADFEVLYNKDGMFIRHKDGRIFHITKEKTPKVPTGQ